ncbi:lipid IV(A) 3-deoxy-D-manno-octulosonic acid transferase [Undibacterium terreum]|uniref:3-deoxy-D-manno-octulosonic acid transferase n=1 Tax=Undibacterium terreum TaxID=1224302 RepID=A0A916XL19_9BURK|nr:lipid IV(A) 3-deoxy-D-manno-octulosonic acid transferase [Undibacterium terreum]GGC83000.1 3-deoxy-D-manno-octulosonic acid transferase [Undibacterium terreum]
MRLLYSLFWGLSLPFALGRLWLRGRQEPGYREHVAERLGFYKGSTSRQVKRKIIWVHAVSAGETRAAEPLVRALLQRYADHHILLTHMTPTGRATGKLLFADVSSRLIQSFLPYDINWMIRRFLHHFSPRLCVLIETEVWPNLVAQCEQHRVPVALVNARLSEKSLKKAHRLPSLILPAARAINCVAAQSGPDAQRLKELGVGKTIITGNMKFDVNPPPQMAERGAQLRQVFGERAVFLCGSTRDGEEELILKAFCDFRQSHPQKQDALLVITPRHPQRFDQVAEMIDAHGLKHVRRSQLNFDSGLEKLPADVQVVLGDSMGEMYMYYAACDVAFIGGSLIPLGGHNLIEACAMAKPVLIGQHTFNFSEITEQAIAAGASIRVTDPADLMAQAHALIADADRRKSMGGHAHAFFMQHQGATDRTMALLAELLGD